MRVEVSGSRIQGLRFGDPSMRFKTLLRILPPCTLCFVPTTLRFKFCAGHIAEFRQTHVSLRTRHSPLDWHWRHWSGHPRTSSESILRSQAERGHEPIIVLVMARVRENGESSLTNPVISSQPISQRALVLQASLVWQHIIQP